MAGMPDKLVAQVAFKAGGDIFHQIQAKNPKHFAKVSPALIQDCELHQGEFGAIGSVIQWNYTIDGRERKTKEVILEVDEEKKLISYKVIEGDLLELYKDMTVTVHVETKGGVDFVTWTLDYELLDAGNPHPLFLLNVLIGLTKDVEAHVFG